MEIIDNSNIEYTDDKQKTYQVKLSNKLLSFLEEPSYQLSFA